MNALLYRNDAQIIISASLIVVVICAVGYALGYGIPALVRWSLAT